jgi:uncharacterized protein (TIGR04255 family)
MREAPDEAGRTSLITVPPVRYSKPPIAEASIIISIKALESSDFSKLDTVGLALGTRFPGGRPLAESELRSTSRKADTTVGMVFRSVDGKSIVQARSDAFQFSRKSPYDSWESFISDARDAWAAYTQTVGSVEIFRVAIKYVNLINIPMNVPLRELFNTYPTLPEADPLLGKMQMFYLVEVDEPKGFLEVLMAFAGASSDGTRGRMVLANTLSYRVDDEDGLWAMMPSVRQAKNAIFESQITEQLRKDFR